MTVHVGGGYMTVHVYMIVHVCVEATRLYM